MKYIVLLGDGMADEPVEALKGQTPLEVAATPNMDRLAQLGELGLAHTVPEGFPPGSDVANLSVFGFDPALCYSGRSPLEAASMGVALAADDVAFRMNLVCLTPTDDGEVMTDFSAGHISTEEAASLVETLQQELGSEQFSFYPGVSYRHLMVWHGGQEQLPLTPPHDLTDQLIEAALPASAQAAPLMELMRAARQLFADHPVNQARQRAGKATATAPWFWGQGKAPRMVPHTERFGLSGAVISAVDLLKGIGIYAGLDVIDVPGATGWIDTNYRGKAEYALEALKTRDYVYVHVEAPDEAAHAGLVAEKIQAIEDFDQQVVGTVLAGMGALGDVRLLVMPDHPTPLRTKTHTSEPVPYILYGTAGEFTPTGEEARYTEKAAAATGRRMAKAHQLMERLVAGQ